MDCWVVRKGCTPLYPAQEGFVGGSMGESAVIIQGRDEAGGDRDKAEDSLFSAPHGAGRAMSRTEAKGKSRKRSRCPDCGWVQPHGTPGQASCPTCGAPTSRVWVQESEGMTAGQLT